MKRQSLPGAMLVLQLIATLVIASGCGGAASGDDAATSKLVITRDFGASKVMPDRNSQLTKGLNPMRQLQAATSIETSYGGRYVTSIHGLAQDAKTSHDWLFYVDGIESDRGATAERLRPGQIVQWDYHRWIDVRTGGAIVGAYPEPLRKRGASVECRPRSIDSCDSVKTALRRDGVQIESSANDTDQSPVRVIVGAWDQIDTVDGVADLTGPAAQGRAFARFSGRAANRRLELASDDGSIARTLTAGSGLIAPIRDGKELTWLITGVDAAGVAQAAQALTPGALTYRFAVAAVDDAVIALPVVAER